MGAKLDSERTTIKENRETLLKTLGELEAMTEYPEKLHSDIVAMLESVDDNFHANRNRLKHMREERQEAYAAGLQMIDELLSRVSEPKSCDG